MRTRQTVAADSAGAFPRNPLLKKSKSQRIGEYIRGHGPDGLRPVCYELYFSLFNAGDYYEAHDVLEHLWLSSEDSNARFYKGLIQIAGAFVHLRKQFLRPEHPKDGRRLRPACRLLALGISNISPFAPVHMDLDVEKLCTLCGNLAKEIEQSGFGCNPWSPHRLPHIGLACSSSGSEVTNGE